MDIEKESKLIQITIEHSLFRPYNQLIEFTEIEFYYFKEGVHDDESVHPHKLDAGMWRVHKSGIDLTFQHDSIEKKDGGILIRGIKCEGEYINGPLRVLNFIFKKMGNAFDKNTIELKEKNINNELIYKTARHGLGKTANEPYKSALYRYFLDVEKWNKKHFSNADLEKLKNQNECI